MDPKTSPEVLAAEVLHEVRQPLLSLKAWLQLVKEDPSRPLPVDVLLAQVARIEHLVNDFTRLAANRPAQRDKLKLHVPVREAIAAAQRPGSHTPMPELEIVFDVEVMGNLGLLQQLALNLINNAREASGPTGRVKVVITREGVKPALYVADWGSGISPELRKKIFEPFVTTKDAGTGLGLAVCRRIAQEHHATLDLALPSVVSESLPPSTVFRLVFDSDSAVAAAPRKHRILVLDDEAVIRLMFKDLLGKEYEVVEAATGEEALALLPGKPFDLVLADKNLPGASGLDVALEIRRSYPHLKLMLMTGYPSLVTAQQSVELGLVDYLVKPFDDIRVVREKVRAALSSAIPQPRKATNRRVDVYEDNPSSARPIAEALTLLGMQPQVLTEAKPGGSDAPAAVVMSWDFTAAHGADGVAFARKQAAGVPFVVLAEHLTMDSALESLRGGAAACLPKLLTDVKALSRELQWALKLP
ncbi:MAG: hybrid sensor histidine kinase/response regulator [Archangiaceae bacterium]|nr:hybrid sensor histidine kinase/response regulator [Archangiaceae bacterium]